MSFPRQIKELVIQVIRTQEFRSRLNDTIIVWLWSNYLHFVASQTKVIKPALLPSMVEMRFNWGYEHKSSLLKSCINVKTIVSPRRDVPPARAESLHVCSQHQSPGAGAVVGVRTETAAAHTSLSLLSASARHHRVLSSQTASKGPLTPQTFQAIHFGVRHISWLVPKVWWQSRNSQQLNSNWTQRLQGSQLFNSQLTVTSVPQNIRTSLQQCW